MMIEMKKVKTEAAVGMILCHDITKIVPEQFKGPAFKKGHVITEQDVPELLKLGKDHIYVWEDNNNMIHENQAAEILAESIGGCNIKFSQPNEGKINLIAKCSGLLKINVELLHKINLVDQVAIATLHNNRVVQSGEIIAGTRVIPLVFPKEKLDKVTSICRESSEKIINILPLKSMNVGLITTGNEVFYGRIKDAFGPVIQKKLQQYGCMVSQQILAPDDQDIISKHILALVDQGVDMVLITGGMSVDPDDQTPAAIGKTGAEIVSYGSPVLPGSMLLVGYYGDIPILGLPGCVMYSKHTVFDLVLPRVLAGEKITKDHIASLGHGGLCLDCAPCVFPNCSFGKGR